MIALSLHYGDLYLDLIQQYTRLMARLASPL